MRTVSATITSAVSKSATQPVYLVDFTTGTSPNEPAQWLCATWDTAISWNGSTWVASGANISNLTAGGCTFTLPASNAWLGAVLRGVRGKPIRVYEHHTDSTVSPQADAVLLFSGIMDGLVLADDIKISAIANSQSKGFPVTSIDRPTFTHLLKSGDRITWGADTVIVN